MTQCPGLEDYVQRFGGVTDLGYLRFHYARFCMTKQFVFESDLPKPRTMLDIGSHWLHHTLLYALEGIAVTASDIPGTFEDPTVRKLAQTHGITLYPFKDLSDPHVFDALPENGFDLILFTEVLEHITFNPVGMWKAIYRVLHPGGRIILTTPNYYDIGGKFWDFKRLIERMGGGISVNEILSKVTNRPHWKEYSAREIRTYFNLLSPDFQVRRLQYVSIPYFPANTFKKKLWRMAERHVRILRSNIFAEIVLPIKEHGITMVPTW